MMLLLRGRVPLSVEQKDVRRSPPKLFSKDTLARRCAKRFGWDPQHTAKLAQELYDQGYLSYPRTESEHLPESQTGDAGAVIESVAEALPGLAHLRPAARDLIFRKGSRGHYVKDPGEHHAIVPLRKAPQGAAWAWITAVCGSLWPRASWRLTCRTALTHARP